MSLPNQVFRLLSLEIKYKTHGSRGRQSAIYKRKAQLAQLRKLRWALIFLF